MNKGLRNWRLLSLFGMMALLLAGCGKPFLSTLQPAGEVADMQYSLMLLSTSIMVLVIVVVAIIFVYVVIRFRRRKGEENKIPKQVEGSHKLEIIWTVIPIILLLILAVPTVSATFKLADVKPMNDKNRDKDTVVVNVRANLYWWEFEYPDYGIITSQDLVVPTNEKVYFNLVASDVKHSFWIPAVGGKMDTNTDNKNQFWLVFDQEATDKAGGVFYGKCAELCGPSHALMDFKVRPLPRTEFDAWVEKMQNAKKPVVTDPVAKQGEAIFNKSCIGCHAVSPVDKRPEQARTAPNLANFGDRERIAGILEHNEENLKRWLRDPESIKPGNKMTGTYGELTEEQIDALTKYLMSLKVE
ncbi:cytochrome c oxidase subunit II [Geobacillus sp. FSL K6-0789]|uniref:Cytochrome c oxidase subunit 2 n=1 Tax=Geobacillus stearothermophilus TaxID=1422 RepID=A0A150MAE9_GEOSE|nr:cytochrome c oxidase subunit II [Geobacillus stearothermophilus]KAF6512042.1 Cytochrome c oxidase polypeptide II [Geobacillus stearothermophilus]KOR95001.1 cytochrome B [Geobacillus stearothermophilus ATCC 12980]KYD21315.1 Cytochrome c oxidase polypeptide II [Geobacillus stearothermophilus]MED3664113.1 cytochrome c oxidase subunit II [Geobacillus stearothermophilus]MED3719686.1 cytochrome c oxidase subunit II [Geobacillus stearothermophilus]